jgi:diguanylate cyclase (GGDEF)-like protein
MAGCSGAATHPADGSPARTTRAVQQLSLHADNWQVRDPVADVRTRRSAMRPQSAHREQNDSRRRLAVATVLAVVLLVSASAGTIWRYQHAIGQADEALRGRTKALGAQLASTLFWRERETMNEYLLEPSPGLLHELAVEQKAFEQTTQDLAVNQQAERTLVLLSRRANAAFLATFQRVHHQAGTGARAEQRAVVQLNGAEEAVLRPLEALQTVYVKDVAQRQAAKSSADRQAIMAALLGVLLALIATTGLAVYSRSLLRDMARRRAADRDSEASQSEFAGMLQATAAEDEADALLKRQLERSIHGSSVVVLRRNNSADRLEATTAIDSDLADRLTSAEPRSCLAVRFGRIHEVGGNAEPLIGCALCASETGYSTCQPLLVGGEVIGSALVSHPEPLDDVERAAIVVSVGQAGPVLANLRNLAVAEFRAATDALTGLPNSRAVHDTVKRMVAQASRMMTPLAALLLDLDHFKQINDSYGHGRGDEVLAAAGTTMQATLRESDFVGRYGGEEFLILLPATGREDALLVAEKIRAAVATITVPGVDRAITASLGVAILPDDAADSVTLLRQADRGLYAAKAKGRNRVDIAEASGALLFASLPDAV